MPLMRTGGGGSSGGSTGGGTPDNSFVSASLASGVLTLTKENGQSTEVTLPVPETSTDAFVSASISGEVLKLTKEDGTSQSITIPVSATGESLSPEELLSSLNSQELASSQAIVSSAVTIQSGQNSAGDFFIGSSSPNVPDRRIVQGRDFTTVSVTGTISLSGTITGFAPNFNSLELVCGEVTNAVALSGLTVGGNQVPFSFDVTDLFESTDTIGSCRFRLKYLNSGIGGTVTATIRNIKTIETGSLFSRVEEISTDTSTPLVTALETKLTESITALTQKVDSVSFTPSEKILADKKLTQLKLNTVRVQKAVHSRVKWGGSDTFADSYLVPSGATSVAGSIDGTFYTEELHSLLLIVVRDGDIIERAFPAITSSSNGNFGFTADNLMFGDSVSVLLTGEIDVLEILQDIDSLKRGLQDLIDNVNSVLTPAASDLLRSTTEEHEVVEQEKNWRLSDNAPISLPSSFVYIRNSNSDTVANEVLTSSVTNDLISPSQLNNERHLAGELALTLPEKTNPKTIMKFTHDTDFFPQNNFISLLSIKELGSDEYRPILIRDSDGIKTRRLVRAGATTSRTRNVPLAHNGNFVYVTNDSFSYTGIDVARTYHLNFVLQANSGTRDSINIPYEVSNVNSSGAAVNETLTTDGITWTIKVQFLTAHKEIQVEMSGFPAGNRQRPVYRININGYWVETVAVTTQNVYGSISFTSNNINSPSNLTKKLALSTSESASGVLEINVSGAASSTEKVSLGYQAHDLDYSKIKIGGTGATIYNIEGAHLESAVNNTVLPTFLADDESYINGYLLPAENLTIDNSFTKISKKIYLENQVDSSGELIGNKKLLTVINFTPFVYTSSNYSASPTPVTMTEPQSISDAQVNGEDLLVTHRHEEQNFVINTGADGVGRFTAFNIDLRTQENTREFYTNAKAEDFYAAYTPFKTTYYGSITAKGDNTGQPKFIIPAITTYHYNNPMSDEPTQVISRALVEDIKQTSDSEPIWYSTFGLGIVSSGVVLNQNIAARGVRLRVDISITEVDKEADIDGIKKALNRNRGGNINFSQFPSTKKNKDITVDLASLKVLIEGEKL